MVLTLASDHLCLTFWVVAYGRCDGIIRLALCVGKMSQIICCDRLSDGEIFNIFGNSIARTRLTFSACSLKGNLVTKY